ncbi:hypothetical protein V8G54_022821 [Vigna mungo]|uniref:Uncharacterized protein n=1 Tax=Vigna mungo TaxID=3915 RepID=A0AAQ3N3S3_VIGMU
MDVMACKRMADVDSKENMDSIRVHRSEIASYKSNVLNIFSGDFLHFATISGNPNSETAPSLVISAKQDSEILFSGFEEKTWSARILSPWKRVPTATLTAFNHFLIFNSRTSQSSF